MLGLKALQQGSKRQDIQEGMEESQVDERVCVKTVHCPRSQNLAVLARPRVPEETYWCRIQPPPVSRSPIVPRSKLSAAPAARKQ